MKNKKTIFLVLTAVLIAAISFIYIFINGQTYKLSLPSLDGKISEINVSYDNEGILKRGETNVDYNAKIHENNYIELKSVSAGNTNVKLTVVLEDDYSVTSTTPMSVNNMGIVFCNISSIPDFNGTEIIVIALSAYLLIICVVMVFSFIRQIKISIYSYKSIIYLGVALFTLFLCVHIVTFLSGYFNMTYSNKIYYLFQSIIISLPRFGIFLFPSVEIMCVAVSVSNIALIRHEGKRPANILGIALSICLFLLIAAMILPEFIYPFLPMDSSLELFIRMFSALQLFFGWVLGYFECLLLSSIICGIISARHTPGYDKDYIIILGCGIAKDGSLLPLLRGRTDRAVEFYKKQKELTGKSAVLIPSGGQGANEIISEAEAMRNYLITQGIPQDDIIMEDKSTTTYENMLFSKRIIDSENPNGQVAFSTTNYHVFRSGIFANKVGLNAEGMGSRTKWYFWPNAFLRELAGVIASKLKINIAIVIIFALFSIAATFLI